MILSGLKTWLETGELLTTRGRFDTAERWSRSDRFDYEDSSSTRRVLLDLHIFEAGRLALSCECLGLLGCPPMAGKAGGAGRDLALEGEEPAACAEYPLHLRESRGDV
jgi:hypothetical protein